jgi:hypothetical protein
MRQFDFYEFAGILLPGGTVLAGLSLVLPDVLSLQLMKDISIGGFGVFAMVAYVLGHLVQAVGNGIEWVWWKLWGGIPSDWVRTKPERLLAKQQLVGFQERMKEHPGFADFDVARATAAQWYSITRQIYAEVAGAGRAARIDVFNGNYSLNRGIAAALLVVAAVALVKAPINWFVVTCVTVGAGLATLRMHRFAKHYARETYVQFLALARLSASEERKGDA